MSVKLADTLAPMGEFPVAEGKDVEVQIGERKKSLQKAIEDGDMGGGGSGKSIIDDETISEESVYSSKKVTDEFLTKNGESSDTTVKFTEPEEYTEPTTGSKLSELVGMIVKGIQSVLEAIGKLTDLKTTDKTSVVGAINEINDSLVDIENDLDEIDQKVDAPLEWNTSTSGLKWSKAQNGLIVAYGTVKIASSTKAVDGIGKGYYDEGIIDISDIPFKTFSSAFGDIQGLSFPNNLFARFQTTWNNRSLSWYIVADNANTEWDCNVCIIGY